MTTTLNPTSALPTSATVVIDQSSLILVVDDSALCRDLLCKELVASGYLTDTAADGEAGLTRVGKQTPAVILLDNEMPKMGGLAFLRTLRADPRWATLPVVMLTTSNSKDVILEAMRCGISGYVLKERLAMPELLHRVHTAIEHGHKAQRESSRATDKSKSVKSAPAAHAAKASNPVPVSSAPAISAPNLVAREATLAGIIETETVKTLAGVVKQIAAITDSSKSSIAEISAVIRQDPVLAARTIQLASSSAYAGSKARISSVDDAVRLVGTAEVQAMAAKVGFYNAFAHDRSDGIDLLRCWQHAFGVASVMARIVPKTDDIPSGVPHLIGLCHDLAEMLLRQRFPCEYTAAIDYASQAGVASAAMLPAVFGASYSELTQAILARLKFPAIATNAINEFLSLPMGSTPDLYRTLLPRSLAIANFMAHGMLLTSSAENRVCPILLTDFRSASIPSATINSAEIRSEAITTVCMLSDLAGDQEQALSQPLIPRRDAKLLYLRHPGFAQMDPLELALKNAATSETHEKVLTANEMSGFDLVIVAAPAFDDPMFSAVIRQVKLMARQIPVLKVSTASHKTTNAPAPENTNESKQCPFSIAELGTFITV